MARQATIDASPFAFHPYLGQSTPYTVPPLSQTLHEAVQLQAPFASTVTQPDVAHCSVQTDTEDLKAEAAVRCDGLAQTDVVHMLDAWVQAHDNGLEERVRLLEQQLELAQVRTEAEESRAEVLHAQVAQLQGVLGHVVPFRCTHPSTDANEALMKAALLRTASQQRAELDVSQRNAIEASEDAISRSRHTTHSPTAHATDEQLSAAREEAVRARTQVMHAQKELREVKRALADAEGAREDVEAELARRCEWLEQCLRTEAARHVEELDALTEQLHLHTAVTAQQRECGCKS